MTALATPTVLRWYAGSADQLVSEIYPLDELAGEQLALQVEAGQWALLLDDHSVRQIWLVGEHTLELAAAGAAGAVPARAQILFVSRARALEGCWGHGCSTQLDHRDDEELHLLLRGRFRARVRDPRRFYDSFLRRCEDLPAERIQRIAAALVHDRVRHALSLQGNDVAALTGRLELWQRECPPAAESYLRDVGLELLECTVQQWELPAGV